MPFCSANKFGVAREGSMSSSCNSLLIAAQGKAFGRDIDLQVFAIELQEIAIVFQPIFKLCKAKVGLVKGRIHEQHGALELGRQDRQFAALGMDAQRLASSVRAASVSGDSGLGKIIQSCLTRPKVIPDRRIRRTP